MEGKILILLACIVLAQCEWVKEMESKIFSIFDIQQETEMYNAKDKGGNNYNCTTLLISGKFGYLNIE